MYLRSWRKEGYASGNSWRCGKRSNDSRGGSQEEFRRFSKEIHTNLAKIPNFGIFLTDFYKECLTLWKFYEIFDHNTKMNSEFIWNFFTKIEPSVICRFLMRSPVCPQRCRNLMLFSNAMLCYIFPCMFFVQTRKNMMHCFKDF